MCKLFVGFSAGDCCNVNEPSVATLNEDRYTILLVVCYQA